MQNGNTLLTAWSQEQYGTTSSYNQVWRSYELIDGAFMPIATIGTNNSTYGTYKNAEVMKYNNSILLDITQSNSVYGSGKYGATFVTRNQSMIGIYSAAIPTNIWVQNLQCIIDTNRKRVLMSNDAGTIYGATRGETKDVTYIYSDTGFKNDWTRFFVTNYDDNGTITIDNNKWNSSKSNLIFVGTGLRYTAASNGYYSNVAAVMDRIRKLFTMSPDGRFFTYPSFLPARTGIVTFDTKNEDYPIGEVAGYTDVTAYIIDGKDYISLGTMPDLLEWTADSRYFITASFNTTNSIRIYRQVDNKFTEVESITDLPRSMYGMFTSPDNRTLAIIIAGSKVGTCDTLIYRRKGDSFSLAQTIENFGKSYNGGALSLAFNGDGSLLIDISTRRAFRMDTTGTFNEDTKIMSRVVAGANVCTLSDHLLQPPTNGFIYDSTVPYFINNPNIDLNLKFCLLSSNAEFHHEHKSIKDVTGENANQSTVEVSGFGWPVGGKKIENAVLTKFDNGSVILNGDNMSTDIAGGTLKFSKAVVYNETTMEPWLWFDFGSEIIIESNTTMNINFSNRGFLIFTP